MHSENGVLVDFEEIGRLVSGADVFTVAFGNFPERLIVDTRSDDRESPMIRVVEPARSARDRLAWLTRRRPSLGVPDQFSFFAWPHSPAFMVESGIWDRICRRIDSSHPDVAVQCARALGKLQNLDYQTSQAVLNGDNCLTLWPREEDASPS